MWINDRKLLKFICGWLSWNLCVDSTNCENNRFCIYILLYFDISTNKIKIDSSIHTYVNNSLEHITVWKCDLILLPFIILYMIQSNHFCLFVGQKQKTHTHTHAKRSGLKRTPTETRFYNKYFQSQFTLIRI